MKLNVNYFGMIAEWTGCSNQTIEINRTGTVGSLRNQLQHDHENLGSISYQIAVNHQIAANEIELKEQDEIAVLPPFAGG
ncbi:MAG: MoaD/ThiS family protein [Flavobacteriales bacterium]|jgi:molybdopterin synthase sulfur carrier subunit|nr:MoaD/ThiS family protein [Flavobacteriales bacterium]